MDRPRKKARPRWRVYLTLARVWELPTIWTGCFAGISLAGGQFDRSLNWLLFALSLMYIAGRYLSDVADQDFDREFHAERPIPAREIAASRVSTISFI